MKIKSLKQQKKKMEERYLNIRIEKSKGIKDSIRWKFKGIFLDKFLENIHEYTSQNLN